jgi:predicted HTH transcriptional regulator
LAYPGSRQPTAFFGRLSRIGEMQKSVSEQIVSFLNGRGGVLFVGCKIGEGGEVFGVAETTSESLKENIENKV